MNSNFVQRKYIVVILASVVMGLAAFVGACALVYSTNWFSSDESDSYPVAESPLVPPHWSPDGTKIVLDSWWGPYLVDASSDGTELRKIVVGGHRERIYPRISPDGSRMVFSTRRHADDGITREIGVSNLDGSNYRRLTRSRGNQYGSEWSPDGSHIAFISFYSVRKDFYYHHSSNLYIMAANGSGPRKLADSVRATGPLAWSPDGRKIAFLGYERNRRGDWSEEKYIYSVDSDGSNLTRLADDSSPFAWSPDESVIAFLGGDDRNSLFGVNPDGSGLRKIVDIDPDFIQEGARDLFPDLSWSPDGSEILLRAYPFIRVKADGTAYHEGGAPYAVFNGPEDWSIAYASWSPDGSRIAITVEQYHGTDSYDGNAILLTMARDGSNNRVLVRFNEGFKFSVDSNEPWDAETGWVWHSP